MNAVREGRQIAAGADMPTLDDRLRWLMYAAFEEGRASVRRLPLTTNEHQLNPEDHFRERAEFEAQKIRDLFAAARPTDRTVTP